MLRAGQPKKARALSKLEKAVSEIVDEMRQMPDRGEVADYIPELAGVDPKSLGLVVIDAAGNVVARGDSDVPFSIQSISKVFTDAGARQDRQSLVGARRPRALG